MYRVAVSNSPENLSECVLREHRMYKTFESSFDFLLIVKTIFVSSLVGL